MADILALVLQHDETLLVQAVDEVLVSGVVTKTHVLNRLSRLLEPRRPPLLEPPSALQLNDEPQANTERYDHLREVHNVR